MFTNEEDYYEDLAERSGAVIYGDARRCPVHPNVKTSSDDGMFDGVCDLCEGEMESWDYDPANPMRTYCLIESGNRDIQLFSARLATCKYLEPEDNIPF
jgi:hypothetical protein